MKRVAIIGGGPIGMEAALYGALAGFDVHLYERGRLCENVRTWGHIGLFTEWKRNRSPLAVGLLRELGHSLPPDDTTSTGAELAEYVCRLAALPQLRGRLHPQTEVVALTRECCLKSDYLHDERRAAFPFRLLVRGARGERVEHADAVLDATGVYATPNWLGSGGAPCPGELSLKNRIDYHLPDVAGAESGRFASRHTLVIGSGHSAASTLLAISELIPEHPRTRITWAVRRDVPQHGFPYTLIPDDPAPHRYELHRRANELTQHSNVDFRPQSSVEAIEHNGQQFCVRLTSSPRSELVKSDGNCAWLACDNVVAHTGFRADATLWSELQIVAHPATGGPLSLAEALMRHNRERGVGLSTGYAELQPDPAVPVEENGWPELINNPELLRQPEPNFFVIGIKSYGRDAGFLMQNGFRQVRDVYELISGDKQLDLYEGALNGE